MFDIYKLTKRRFHINDKTAAYHPIIENLKSNPFILDLLLLKLNFGGNSANAELLIQSKESSDNYSKSLTNLIPNKYRTIKISKAFSNGINFIKLTSSVTIISGEIIIFYIKFS